MRERYRPLRREKPVTKPKVTDLQPEHPFQPSTQASPRPHLNEQPQPMNLSTGHIRDVQILTKGRLLERKSDPAVRVKELTQRILRKTGSLDEMLIENYVMEAMKEFKEMNGRDYDFYEGKDKNWIIRRVKEKINQHSPVTT